MGIRLLAVKFSFPRSSRIAKVDSGIVELIGQKSTFAHISKFD